LQTLAGEVDGGSRKESNYAIKAEPVGRGIDLVLEPHLRKRVEDKSERREAACPDA